MIMDCVNGCLEYYINDDDVMPMLVVTKPTDGGVILQLSAKNIHDLWQVLNLYVTKR